MYYQVKHSDSDLNKENGTSGVTREGNILKMQQIDVTKKNMTSLCYSCQVRTSAPRRLNKRKAATWLLYTPT
jgi:hypothetical protein